VCDVGDAQGWKAARARCHKVVARLQAVAGVRSRSYRQRGQVGGGSGWLMKSPLARRMFSREQVRATCIFNSKCTALSLWSFGMRLEIALSRQIESGALGRVFWNWEGIVQCCVAGSPFVIIPLSMPAPRVMGVPVLFLSVRHQHLALFRSTISQRGECRGRITMKLAAWIAGCEVWPWGVQMTSRRVSSASLSARQRTAWLAATGGPLGLQGAQEQYDVTSEI